MYRFCSEFTKHELKLQAFLLSQNTQGEDNSTVDKDLGKLSEESADQEVCVKILFWIHKTRVETTDFSVVTEYTGRRELGG